MPDWTRALLGVLAAVGIVGTAGYCWGHDAGTRAGAATATAGLERRVDSVTRVADAARAAEARFRAVNDSLRRAGRADSVHLAAIAPRIRLVSPTVIAVDTSRDIPGGSFVNPPPVLVSVPAEVTDLIATLERRNRQLELLLAVADSGWAASNALAAAERSTRLLRERELAIERASRPRWGVKTGMALGALAMATAVYAAGRLD